MYQNALVDRLICLNAEVQQMAEWAAYQESLGKPFSFPHSLGDWASPEAIRRIINDPVAFRARMREARTRLETS